MSAHQYNENERIFSTEIDGTSINVVVDQDFVYLEMGGDETLWKKRGKSLFELFDKLLTNEGYTVRLSTINTRKKEVSFYLRLPNTLDKTMESVSPSNYIMDIELAFGQLKTLAESTDDYSGQRMGFEKAVTELQGAIKLAPNPSKKIATKAEMAKRATIAISNTQLHDVIRRTLQSMGDEIGISSEQALDVRESIVFALQDAQRDSEMPKVPIRILGKEFRDAIREGLKEGLHEVGVQVSPDMEAQVLTRLFTAIRSESTNIEGGRE